MDKELEERNYIWNIAKTIINKRLKINYAFLDPHNDEFGNFIEDNIESFDNNFEKTLNELKENLPNNYIISKAHIIGNDYGLNKKKGSISFKKVI